MTRFAILTASVFALLLAPESRAQPNAADLLTTDAELVFDDFRYQSLDLCHYWTSRRFSCSPPTPEDASLFGPNSWAVRSANGKVETRTLGPAWYRFGWTNNSPSDGSAVEIVTPTGAVDRQGFAVRTFALPNGQPPADGYPDVMSGLVRRTGTWVARVRLSALGLPTDTGADLIQAFWGISPDGIRYENGFERTERSEACHDRSPSNSLCYDASQVGKRLYGTELDHEWNNYFDGSLLRKHGGAFDAVGVRQENPQGARYLLGTEMSLRDHSALPAGGAWAVLTMRLSETHARFDVHSERTGTERTGRSSTTGWNRLEYPTTRAVTAHFSQHFFCHGGAPCAIDPALNVEMLVDWFLFTERPDVTAAQLLASLDALRLSGHPRYYQGAAFETLSADAGNLFDGTAGLGRQTPPVKPGTTLGGALLPPERYRALDPDVWAADPYNAADRSVRGTDYEVAWRWRPAASATWSTAFARGSFNARPPASLRVAPACAQVRIRDLGSIRQSSVVSAECSVDTFGCAGRPAPTDGPGRPYREGDPEVEWTSLTVCERE